MNVNLKKTARKFHYWISVVVAIPAFVVFISGMLLLLKKEVAWIQPPTQRGSATTPAITFDDILKAATSVPEAGIQGWEDIDRLDVRPEKGIVKVRAKNSWEIQLDTQTGEILQVAVRRSDLIESLHDGSYFHEHAKLWVFFPTGLMLLILVLTGVHLFCLPYLARRRRKH